MAGLIGLARATAHARVSERGGEKCRGDRNHTRKMRRGIYRENSQLSRENLRLRINGLFTFNAQDYLGVGRGHMATEGAVSPNLGGRPKF